MVVPLALLGAASVFGGHAARIGITSSGMRAFSGQFVQSLPFGAGYSLGTYLGFPKNYQSNNRNYNRSPTTLTLNTMPYTRYGRYYSRYPRRGSRYGRRRYSRYGRRSYRRYY